GIGGATVKATSSSILIGISALLLILFLVPLLFMGLMMAMGSMMGLQGLINCDPTMMQSFAGGTAPGLTLPVFGLLVATGLVLLLVWAVRGFGGARQTIGAEPPLAVLQRRYAAGEIDPEDYARIRADLLRDERAS